ncbi:MAG TPA: hypothetical protein VHC72_19795 [Bryobacteraceae bacterium]|nr:hypothetical protein [Bryobacteraceae bacterium]
MLPKWKLALIAILAAAGVGIAIWYSVDRYRDDKTVNTRLETITKDYRQILILRKRWPRTPTARKPTATSVTRT